MAAPSAVERSPFLRPSNPRLIKKAQQSQKITKTDERKSSALGAYANLCNVCMGAGIVGMPYALKEAGLVSGTVMIIICAFLTEYSLRQLISLGKVADVNSYETLMEASFGRPGFVFLSVNMFLLSLGSMIAYLIIIKDTLPVLLHAPEDDHTKRLIMFISSLLIILPLSLQRDISDLEKTSKFNVILNSILVALVAFYSPVKESVAASGGMMQLISDEKILDFSTFFIGFGVCSFAFVCQDSSFIIAGSMSKPTKFRWQKVTRGAMLTCLCLEMCMGVSGYLAYQENSDGNVLNNMNPNHWSGVVSRALSLTTMFFAYPINLYIARHACMVLLFKGVSAHEGDDARVLTRSDRRIILTLVLYFSSLLAGTFLEKTGSVLAATGAIGGTSIAYIGPGASYLAVYGNIFLNLVRSRWHDPSHSCYGFPRQDEQHIENTIEAKEETSTRDTILWYALGMPIWCSVAQIGEKQLAAHFEQEMLISPGIILPRRVTVKPIRAGTQVAQNHVIPPSSTQIPVGSSETSSLLDLNSATRYVTSLENPQDSEIQPKPFCRIDSMTSVEVKIEMDKTVPTMTEFCIAIGYIILGIVAMTFGLGSIIVQN